MELPQPPDFEYMIAIANMIGTLAEEISDLDIKIKEGEAKAVREYTTNPEYFRDKKALAYNVISATVGFTGMDNELVSLRKAKGIKEAQKEKYELIFKSLQDQVKVFQTVSSNQRQALI